MKTYKILATLAASLLFSFAHAQNISSSKLNWSSVSTFIPPTAETTNEATQLITYASDSIQWLAPNGVIKNRLKILEVNGTWADVSQSGTITYEVDNQGKRGVITIARSSDIKVRMMLTTDAEPAVYELTINSIKTF